MKLRYMRNRGLRCSNCRLAPAYAKGRCEPCYRWWKRTGEERPYDVRVAHNARIFAPGT